MIQIHIKWILVIVFTLAYIITLWWFSREDRGTYGTGPIFEWGFATIVYLSGWVLWLIIW